MSSSSASGLPAVALGFLLVSACSEEPAELSVELGGMGQASPQYFHGNCFAGWSVTQDLRARETMGVEVVLSSFRYRLVDPETSEEIGADELDSAAIEARYGSMANILPGRSSRVFSIGGFSGGRPSDRLEVTGSLSGRDENGRAVSTSFTLNGSITIEEVPPPSGGACAPS